MSPETAAIQRRVHGAVVGAPPPEGVGLADHLGALVADAAPLLGPEDRAPIVAGLLADLTGLGPLEPVLADPEVTEVMVNAGSGCWVERRGVLEAVPLALSEREVLLIVERCITRLGLRLDLAAPMVDARLPDGSRLHAVIPPVAVDGVHLTIRRPAVRRVPVEEFLDDPAARALLRAAVGAGANLVVAGGTGAGKTTLVNALAAWFEPGCRVVTVEETAELRLGLPHVVRLEARPANAEGQGAVGVRDLVRTALRMRPDRLIVGEVRGPEVLDMLQALNTGHGGSCTTLHANGAAEALHRLEALAVLGGGELPIAAVRAHLAAAIDLVVVVERGPHGRRRVREIAEVSPPGTRIGVSACWTRGGGLVALRRRRPRLEGC
ncbi:MAG: CpaF family protein [Actinomycetes bacterium]